MNHVETAPKITKETKNKIRVDFERTPLIERLRAKFLNTFFFKKVFVYIFKFLFLLGISYVILFPFYSKIASSFMSPSDFVDVTVRLIPKQPTLGTYKAIIFDNGYFKAFGNTLLLSGACAILQTFVCCVVGYGFAKFKFRGRGFLFMLVMLTMIIPHQTLQLSMFMTFRYFDIFGIFQFLGIWDEYLWPFLMLQTMDKYTLPVGLSLFNGQYFSNHGGIFAAATIAVVPVLVVYLLFQRQFVEGIALSGIKG